MFIRRNAAKSEENIHLDLTIIFPIKIQVVFVNIMVKAPMYKALLYALRESDEFLDYVLNTVIDFSIFTGRLLNMGRVLVISLVMGLIVFPSCMKSLYQLVISVLLTTVNCLQNSLKYILVPRGRDPFGQ